MGAKEEAKKLYDRTRIYHSANLGLATDDALKTALKSRGYIVVNQQEIVDKVNKEYNHKQTMSDVLIALKENIGLEIMVYVNKDGQTIYSQSLTNERLKNEVILNVIELQTKKVESLK